MDEKKIKEVQERMVQAFKLAKKCWPEDLRGSNTGIEVGITLVAVKIYDELK